MQSDYGIRSDTIMCWTTEMWETRKFSYVFKFYVKPKKYWIGKNRTSSKAMFVNTFFQKKSENTENMVQANY